LPKYDCWDCKKQVAGTKNDRYRSHSGGDGEPCAQSSEPIPEHILAQPVSAGDDPTTPREGVDYAVCPQCDRKVKLTRLGYFEPHDTTLRGGDRCPVGGVRAKHARRTDDVLLPGDGKPGPARPRVSAQEEITSPAPTSKSAPADSSPKELPPSSGPTEQPVHERNLARDPMVGDSMIDWDKVGDLKHLPEVSPGPDEDEQWKDHMAESVLPAGSSASTETSSPESATTSKPSPEEPSGGTTSSAADAGSEEESALPAVGPFHLAPLLDETVLQPFSHISQPFPVPPRIRLAEAMSDRGKEIANRLRETFYAYTNRDHSSNRSAQKTLGPSEIGSPCDRQIAMKLLGVRPTNPQEGWAPFVGTAVHVELAKMFEWANGSGSGRYITEMPLEFGHPLVPKGTLDLYDGMLLMVDDHKLMGRWSLDKLIQNGPSETYLTQIQVYGLGAEKAGLKVKEVAIFAWPRQESSLDKLYVHVEKYDRKVAEAALRRVERIAERVQEIRRPDGLGDTPSEMSTAQVFEVGDDCKWCPFHLKGDKEMKRGCPGK